MSMSSARIPIPDGVEKIASAIVDSGLKAHKTLDAGLLESVYENCLVHELRKRGLDPRQQVNQPIVYDAVELQAGLRIDLLVNGVIVVETKSVEALLPVHQSQLLTYLKLSGCRLGFLMNFNVPLFKDGLRRLIV